MKVEEEKKDQTGSDNRTLTKEEEWFSTTHMSVHGNTFAHQLSSPAHCNSYPSQQ